MLKRWFGAMAAVVLSAGLLGGATVSADETVLQFWTPDNPPYISAAISQFEAENPGVKIVHQFFGWGKISDKVITGISAGSPPDLFTHGTGGVVTFAAAGMLMPLDDALAKYGIINDFFPTYLKASTWEGQLYGLPWTGSGTVLITNRRLLSESGLAQAYIPVHWDDVGSVGRKLVRIDANGKMTRSGFGLPTSGGEVMHAFSTFMRQFGAPFFSDDGRQALFTSEAALSAMNAYTDVVLKDGVTSPGAPQGAGALGNDQEAMGWGTTGTLKSLWNADTREKDNWIVSDLPYSLQKATFGGGSTIMIPRNSPHPELALRFAVYLTSAKVAAGIVDTLNFPPRFSMARQAFVQDQPQVRALFYAFQYAVPSPTNSKWVLIYPHIDELAAQAVTGKKSPQQALGELQSVATGILAQ